MKLIIALFVLVATAAAAPAITYSPYAAYTTPKSVQSVPKIVRADVADPKLAVILRYDNDNIGVDGYSYAVETSDGQAKSEQGTVINAGSDQESIAVKGEFSYVGPDGVTYSISYIADDNGFQPIGAHIPTANVV